MYIQNPSVVLRLKERTEELTSDGAHYLLRMRRDASMFLLNNRNKQPSSQSYAAAADFMSEISGLQISPEQAEALLSLYPHVRIKLAVDNSIAPTDTRDDLSFIVSHFFLGSSWPTFGDKLDINEFLALLQQQATAMGYSVNQSMA